MLLALHCILSLILAWNVSAAIPAFLRPRFSSRLSAVLRTALLYLLCLFPIIPDFASTYLVSFAAFAIYLLAFYSERKEKTAAFSVIFFSIIGSWSYLSSWWIQRITSGGIPFVISLLVASLLIILSLLYFSIFRVHFKQVSESMLLDSFTSRMWNYATIVAITPSALVLTLVASPPTNILLQQAMAFLAIGVSTVIFPLLYQMGRSAKLSEENSRLKVRAQFYQGIEQQQNEIRKMKHDLMNHLTVIATYIDLGESEKAMDYLKEIGAKFSEMTEQYTPSTLLNAILNSKRQKALMEGITLVIKADMNRRPAIDEMDLCTLVANSLDNAIEASPPDKMIRLELILDGSRLLYTISNSYVRKIQKQADGSYISSKDDKANHGIGIRSMEEAVSRMGGRMDISAHDSVFRLEAVIPVGNP